MWVPHLRGQVGGGETSPRGRVGGTGNPPLHRGQVGVGNTPLQGSGRSWKDLTPGVRSEVRETLPL